MVPDALRSLWVDPRPANPPTRGARDWALVAALVGWTVVEAVLRQDMAPRPLLLLAALAAIAAGHAPAGYGLVRMRERAMLLGGTFHAGPTADRGWRVEAVLPRAGTP